MINTQAILHYEKNYCETNLKSLEKLNANRMHYFAFALDLSLLVSAESAECFLTFLESWSALDLFFLLPDDVLE